MQSVINKRLEMKMYSEALSSSAFLPRIVI